MIRKILLMILILVFSFSSAKSSLAFVSCNERPSCCSPSGEMPCAGENQNSSSHKFPVPSGHPKSCCCDLKQDTAFGPRELAQQLREPAKTWKKLKFVSSPSPDILMIDKIRAEEENLSPPSLYRILSSQDPPLRC